MPPSAQNDSPATAYDGPQRPEAGNKGPLFGAIAFATVVVVLRAILSRANTFCGTPDSCFYLGMAQSLASGHGFHTHFLYDFQQANPTLPNTGIEYWRPGVSLLLLVLKPFGGVTLHASIVLTILAGVLLSAAAWHVAVGATRSRRLALASFALCLMLSPVWIGSATPDSSLYYGAAAAWFLALFTVRRQSLLADLLALACVAVDYSIRNDAALLLVPLLAVLWARRGTRGQAQRPAGSSAAYALLMLAGFALALLPMHLLYRAVLGTALPSGTSRVLFLNDLSDFGRYGDPVSLHWLLGHGIKHLLLFRVATVATIAYRVPVLMLGYAALVFLPGLLGNKGSASDDVAGLQQRPPVPELRGAGAFALTILVVYGLVLPAIGGFSALRSAMGLLPVASVLVMVAIVRLARTPRLAQAAATAVIAATGLAGLMETRRNLAVANDLAANDRAQAALLRSWGTSPAGGVVLTNDPVQFSVTTGYPSVALPSNGIDAISAAARDFHATHVILDSGSLPASPQLLQERLHAIRSATLEREHSLVLELPATYAKP